MASVKRSPAALARANGAGNDLPGKLIDPHNTDLSLRTQRAARWLARHRSDVEHPIVPALRSRFGLTAVEAVRAIAAAGRLL